MRIPFPGGVLFVKGAELSLDWQWTWASLAPHGSILLPGPHTCLGPRPLSLLFPAPGTLTPPERRPQKALHAPMNPARTLCNPKTFVELTCCPVLD